MVGHEAPAVYVSASAEDDGDCLRCGGRVVVRIVDIAVGIAVRGNIAIELPRVAEQGAEQPVTRARGHAIDRVVAGKKTPRVFGVLEVRGSGVRLRVNLHMMPEALPSSTHAWKLGK
jgi:hypothetical protein